MRKATGKTSDMARHGRHGDTEVVHVNALEKALLKALGGAGTKNPKTGMREYYDASYAGGQVGSGYSGFDSAFGGGSGTSPGRDQEERDLESAVDNAYSTGIGPGMVTGGPSQSLGPPGPPPAAPDAGRSGGLSGLIESVIATNKPSVLAPTSRITYELAKGLGNYVGRPLNDMFGGNALPETAQFDPSGRMGGEGRNDALSAAVGVQPGVQQAPAFMRPPELELPTSLGLPAGLSDLQKRTMIATYGSQGAQGQYRTPDAMRAYGNLIARALIGDNNQLVGNETGTLPIEDQYLKQAFGLNKPNSASALLEALRPYWSA